MGWREQVSKRIEETLPEDSSDEQEEACIKLIDDVIEIVDRDKPDWRELFGFIEKFTVGQLMNKETPVAFQIEREAFQAHLHKRADVHRLAARMATDESAVLTEEASKEIEELWKQTHYGQTITAEEKKAISIRRKKELIEYEKLRAERFDFMAAHLPVSVAMFTLSEHDLERYEFVDGHQLGMIGGPMFGRDVR